MKESTADEPSGNSRAQNSVKLRYTVHHPDPDYTKDQLIIPVPARQRMADRLRSLYGAAAADTWLPELERILKVYHAHKPQAMIKLEQDFDPTERFTEQDMVLITYGDLVRGGERSPLATLGDFLAGFKFNRIFNTVHILPFFPYSSDKGFSITNFRTVDPTLGSWQDIEEIGNHYQLMFDSVLNHTSSRSRAFKEFLNGDPEFENFFIAYQTPEELTAAERKLIVRPRTSDILTEFQSLHGPVWVWTTFSPDQIDLNYKNPQVLIKAIDTLLLYVCHGADIIRLDAVTYLWDEPGTPSVHLEQTHQIIKLFRDVLDLVAPGVALLTETNVPHRENVSYFGNGRDEAQLVYNFALPPLVLHAFYKADATALTGWARELTVISETTTFFNMLDTHDGVGLMGVKNILPTEEVNFIIQKAKEHGAFISYKAGQDGVDEPYEINTTWFSALNRDNGTEDLALQVKRFVASRSIALVLRGVPGIYFHGLIGTSNDTEAVIKTKSKRDINRKVIDVQTLNDAVGDPRSKLAQITRELLRVAQIRVQRRAFHPRGEQRVLTITPEIFALLRISPAGDERVLTLTNVTGEDCPVEIALADLGSTETCWYDLIGSKTLTAEQDKLCLTLRPYDIVWLIPFAALEKSIEE